RLRRDHPVNPGGLGVSARHFDISFFIHSGASWSAVAVFFCRTSLAAAMLGMSGASCADEAFTQAAEATTAGRSDSGLRLPLSWPEPVLPFLSSPARARRSLPLPTAASLR